MLNTTLKINDSTKTIATYNINENQRVILDAQRKVRYELVDENTGFAPENIITQRIGNDLHIFLEDNDTESDIVIQEYYAEGLNEEVTNMIVGQHENGNIYSYVPHTAEESEAISMLADKTSAAQALGGEEVGALWAFSPWWLLPLIPLAAVAFSGSGSKKSKTAKPAENNAPEAADAKIDVKEDHSVEGKLPIASDKDGDSVTYAKGSNPKNGKVVVKPDGTYVYTPNPDFNGKDSFTYTINDGKGGKNTYTVNINVIPVNDAPTAQDTAVKTNEDQVLNGELPKAKDSDGDSVTYTKGSDPKNGKVVVNPDGTYVYTPNPDFNGKDSFTYTIDDGKGGKNTYTVNIDVIPVNDAPTAQDTAVKTNEDQVLNGELPKAKDSDGDSVTYTKGSDPKNGKVVVNPDGTYVYTPNPDFNGKDSFTYTIDDGKGGKNTYTVNIDVIPVNDAPTAQDTAVKTNEDQVLNGELPKAKDSDGDSVTYTKGSDPKNGKVVVNPDGTYVYTPNPDFNGKDSFTYTIDDGKGGKNTYTVNIDVIPTNDAPTAEDTAIKTPENTPITRKLPEAEDKDGDDVTYIKGTDPKNGTVAINPDGTYTYTPNTDFDGKDSFTYVIDDGKGGTNSYTVDVDVIPRPIDAFVSITIEDGIEKGKPDNIVNAAEVKTTTVSGSVVKDGLQTVESGKEVKVTLTDADGKTVEAVATVDDKGNWETPKLDLSELKDGTLRATAEVINNDGNTATGNDTTVKDTTAEISVVIEDGALKGQPDEHINAKEENDRTVSGHVKDKDGNLTVEAGQTVTVKLSDGTSTIEATATVKEDGTWETEPSSVRDLNDGKITATVSVTDKAGNTAEGSDTSMKDTVAPVPSVVAKDNGDVVVKPNPATDFDTVEISYRPKGEDKDKTVTLTRGEDGNWTSDNPELKPNAEGEVTFPGTILEDDSPLIATSTDKAGNTGSSQFPAAPTAKIKVVAEADNIVTEGDAEGKLVFLLQQDKALASTSSALVKLTTPAVANAATADDIQSIHYVGENGEEKTLTEPAEIAKALSEGFRVEIGAGKLNSAEIVIVPKADREKEGQETLSLTISDAQNADISKTAGETTAVGLINDPVNQLPVADNATVTTAEDQPFKGNLPEAKDADGDTVTYSKGEDPKHGKVEIEADGKYTYTPNADYNGKDSFTYTVDDGNGGTNTYTVEVDVTPVNDAPVAANDKQTTEEDKALNGQLPKATDKENDPVTYAKETEPKNGKVEVKDDGSYVYTPNPDFHGEDSFTYTVSDDKGGKNTYTVDVTVTPVNDPPVAKDDKQTTEEDKELKGQLPTATDKDNDDVTYSVVTQPTNGTVDIKTDGTYTYTPKADFNGEDSFTYKVSDGKGGENTYKVDVTVTPAKHPTVSLTTEVGTATEGAANDGDTLVFKLGLTGAAKDKASVLLKPKSSSEVKAEDIQSITYTDENGQNKSITTVEEIKAFFDEGIKVGFNKDQKESEIKVKAKVDTVVEPDEKLSLEILSPTKLVVDTDNNTAEGTLKDPAVVSIVASKDSGTEGDDKDANLIFNLALDKAVTSDASVLVKLLSDGQAKAEDFDKLSYTDETGQKVDVTDTVEINKLLTNGFKVQIPANQNKSPDITLHIKDDDEQEGVEKVKLGLSEPSDGVALSNDPAKTTVEGTINDPVAAKVSLIVDPNYSEAVEASLSKENLVFNITTDKTDKNPVTVTVKLDNSGENPADAADIDKITYINETGVETTVIDQTEISKMLNDGFKVQVPAGQIKSPIKLHVKDDKTVEVKENLSLKIEAPQNADLADDINAVATIQDPQGITTIILDDRNAKGQATLTSQDDVLNLDDYKASGMVSRITGVVGDQYKGKVVMMEVTDSVGNKFEVEKPANLQQSTRYLSDALNSASSKTRLADFADGLLTVKSYIKDEPTVSATDITFLDLHAPDVKAQRFTFGVNNFSKNKVEDITLNTDDAGKITTSIVKDSVQEMETLSISASDSKKDGNGSVVDFTDDADRFALKPGSYTFVHENGTKSTTSEDGFYSIDPNSGEIKIVDNTKRYMEYNLYKVEVSDLQDNITLQTVEIGKPNPAPRIPTYINQYDFYYYENSPADTLIGTINETFTRTIQYKDPDGVDRTIVAERYGFVTEQGRHSKYGDWTLKGIPQEGITIDKTDGTVTFEPNSYQAGTEPKMEAIRDGVVSMMNEVSTFSTGYEYAPQKKADGTLIFRPPVPAFDDSDGEIAGSGVVAFEWMNGTDTDGDGYKDLNSQGAYRVDKKGNIYLTETGAGNVANNQESQSLYNNYEGVTTDLKHEIGYIYAVDRDGKRSEHFAQVRARMINERGMRWIEEDIYWQRGVSEEGKRVHGEPIDDKNQLFYIGWGENFSQKYDMADRTGSIVKDAILKLYEGDDTVFLRNSVGQYGAIWGDSGHLDVGNGNNYVVINNDITGSKGNWSNGWDKTARSSVQSGDGNDIIIVGDRQITGADADVIQNAVVLTGGGSDQLIVRLGNIEQGSTVDMGSGDDIIQILNMGDDNQPQNNIGHIKDNSIVVLGQGNDSLYVTGHVYESTVIAGEADKELLQSWKVPYGNNEEDWNFDLSLKKPEGFMTAPKDLKWNEVKDNGVDVGNDLIIINDYVYNSYIYLGKGNDLLQVDKYIQGSTIDLGEGNDILVLSDSVRGNSNITGGAGKDTLEFKGNSSISTADFKGFEEVDVLKNGTFTVKASDLLADTTRDGSLYINVSEQGTVKFEGLIKTSVTDGYVGYGNAVGNTLVYLQEGVTPQV
ncbi:tandem-95 repeat protein [Pasteurella testudinis]|uniref:tandem-95 repeat protein n=1 Tax=Pasteurella testudinis TaxID=761 RepID=UPI004058A0C7